MGNRQQMAAMAQQQMAQQPAANPATAFNPVAPMQGGFGLSPEYIQQLIALANPGGILRAGQLPQSNPSGTNFLLGATTSPMPTREQFTKPVHQNWLKSGGLKSLLSGGSLSNFNEAGYLNAMDQWEKAKYGQV